jgi:hypothetical protein
MAHNPPPRRPPPQAQPSLQSQARPFVAHTTPTVLDRHSKRRSYPPSDVQALGYLDEEQEDAMDGVAGERQMNAEGGGARGGGEGGGEATPQPPPPSSVAGSETSSQATVVIPAMVSNAHRFGRRPLAAPAAASTASRLNQTMPLPMRGLSHGSLLDASMAARGLDTSISTMLNATVLGADLERSTLALPGGVRGLRHSASVFGRASSRRALLNASSADKSTFV